MTFVDPKTGKEYKGIIEAARATLCPGPCMDCPLRDMSSQSQSYQVNAEKCTLWAYDHPTAFAERMGLVVKQDMREDMTLGEVQELCIKRQGEFHGDSCETCTMYDPGRKDCALKTYVSGTPADWKLYTGLQFKDFAERKKLNSLYDAYGKCVTIYRYSKDELVMRLGEYASAMYHLPGDWFPELPNGTWFSLDEAHKNKFMFVPLVYNAPDNTPHRQPSFGEGANCNNGQPHQPMQPGQIEQEDQ